jgi:two-component system, OmpR family, phosphate regulon sensor histidine kinase PhoR
MSRQHVPFAIILKFMAVVSLSPLVVLAVLVVLGEMDITAFLVGYMLILTGSLLFVYPFLKNMVALTDYVKALADDRKAIPPDLSVINMMFAISDALANLQALWERKKQEMQTIITEREILVDTLPDILIMIDNNKKVLRTNRAARAIFGQNLSKHHLSTIIPNTTLLDAVDGVLEDLRGREIEFRLEEPVIRDFLAIIERFPISSKGGISVVITMNDITELKSVEQMRADFVANASHEIRTPLASISGMIETIRGPARDDDPAIDEFLGIMAEQAERMRQLINDLLSLSKIEMNAHSIPTDPVDLAKVIRAETRYFELPSREKSMNIILDLHDDMPMVKGDRNELAQIVHNLIGNALKYGNAGTEILVVAKVTNDLPSDQNMRNLNQAVMFSVRDQSEGIPKEHLVRLTERFYRVDSARTRQVGGTGLGLAIVKGILTRHRGAITITSMLGQGSNFTVFFPLYEE